MDSTSKEQIELIVKKVQDGAKSGKLIPLDKRLDQLRNLYYGLSDLEDEFYSAATQDLNRSREDTESLEIHGCLLDLEETIEHLPKWIKPRKVGMGDMRHIAAKKYVQYKPLGSVLVLSPWNYPIFLSLPAVTAAIAAGNTVVLKPSENSPNVSRTLKHLADKYLDPDVFQVVLGAVSESSALLNDFAWDKIMVTGSTNLGKIAYQAAAKHLTPVVLELGGKSPAFVSSNSSSDLDLFAKRIVWGKFVNSGQTCVAPDYVLIDKKSAPEFKKNLIKWSQRYLGGIDEKKPGYVHAPTLRLADRLRHLIATSKGTVIFGEKLTEAEAEKADGTSKFVAPVILENVKADDSLMQEEIFGPILPIVEVDDIVRDGINFVTRPGTDQPLALYIFVSDDKKVDYIQSRIRAGAVSVYDSVIHVSCTALPFGGVGPSGIGNYHGEYGYKSFSHEQGFYKQPKWAEFLLGVRYGTLNSSSTKLMRTLALKKPWFSRTGPVQKSILRRLGLKSLSLLTAFVLLLAYFAK